MENERGIGQSIDDNATNTSAASPTTEHSTDTSKLYDEQIEKNILRNLLGHPLSTDIDGYTPQTRKVLTNTPAVTYQIKRNDRGVIMSYEGSENYELDIQLTDTKYSEDNFTNAIDIVFRELPELKAPTADELADKKRIAELEKKLDLEKAVNNMLQDQLNNAKDELSSAQEMMDDLEELDEQITSTNQVQSAITATGGRGEDKSSPQVSKFKIYKRRAESIIANPAQADVKKVRSILATEVKISLSLIEPDRIKSALTEIMSDVNTLIQNPNGSGFDTKLLSAINDAIKIIELEETKSALSGRG